MIGTVLQNSLLDLLLAIRIEPSTEPLKSSVSRAGVSASSRSSTSERDSARISFTAVLSRPSSVLLTVATSGNRFRPSSRASLLQAQALKKGIEDNELGKGCQLLIFELDLG